MKKIRAYGQNVPDEKFATKPRNVEDLLAERGIDISYETVRHRWNRFGPLFAAEIRKKRALFSP
jgi:putative transposase